MNGYFGIIRPPYIWFFQPLQNIYVSIFPQSFNYKHIF